MTVHARARVVLLVVVLGLAMAVATPRGQDASPPPYLDPARPVAERVDDLVSRMTLDEKVGQLMNKAPAIDRLGVPAYNWWNEALHGLARAGLATVFPQAIGLAATWDAPLVHEVATVISDEARAKHHDFARRDKRGLYQGLTFWSPNINIFRDPRWGRGMETYGEDPFLSGRLAVEFVRGMQGDDARYLKTVATPKHYAVHSGPEPDRHGFDAITDERDLRETYLPQFEMAIREGGAFSVMCAYNRYRGEPACASRRLLGDILRGEWAFPGYVVSDCDAIDDIFTGHKVAPTAAAAAAMGVKGGCDLNCGTTYEHLTEAAHSGLVTEAEIDTGLRRLLTARFRLGMFDPPAQVPYASTPLTVVDSPAHRQVALRAARESIVLLKNEKGALPLRRDLKTIAVIGPNADDARGLLANYSGWPSSSVTPLDGVKRKLGAYATVLYALGAEWADGMPVFEPVPTTALRPSTSSGQVSAPTWQNPAAGVSPWATSPASGLTAEYFDNATLAGEPVFTRVDARPDFEWWDATPDPRITNDDDFSVRWSGEIVAPVTGTYDLGAFGLTGFRLYLDGKLIAEFRDNHEPGQASARVRLEKGKPRLIRLEYFDKSPNARIRLIWSRPREHLQREAVAAAQRADAVVMFLGLSPRLEGEEMRVPVKGFKGGDRVDLGLPAVQEKLLRAVVATGKPTVLVLLNGSAIACPWAAEHVPAIVEAWYPGQAAGDAIADVLVGDVNPGGRLPVTVYRGVDQLPPFADYRMAQRTYRYFTGEPLFPFGHGLSYTRFSYDRLVVPPRVATGQPLTVSVEVTNAGSRAGDEVVQLYVRDVDASVPVPIRSLQGFTRVTLAPGERRTVSFTIAPRQLSIITADEQRLVEPGTFEVAVGGKQPGFSGVADASTTSVVVGRFEVVGEAPVP